MKFNNFSSCDIFKNSSSLRVEAIMMFAKVASSKYTNLLNGVSGGNVRTWMMEFVCGHHFYFLTT